MATPNRSPWKGSTGLHEEIRGIQAVVLEEARVYPIRDGHHPWEWEVRCLSIEAGRRKNPIGAIQFDVRPAQLPGGRHGFGLAARTQSLGARC